MEWREPREDEHELLIKYLKSENFERIILGIVTVGIFVAILAYAVFLLVTDKIGILRAAVIIGFSAIGIVAMLVALKSDGKLKMAREKKYHVCDCRVRDKVVSAGYKHATYYVNVIAGNGKRYKIKVNSTVSRQAKEGRRAFIVGYLTENKKRPWDLVIRKDIDDAAEAVSDVDRICKSHDCRRLEGRDRK